MLKQLLARKTDFNEPDDTHGPTLRRTLGPWGLTALGIGAVIGGGIFVITGQAAADHAGPAVILSFILAAICSTFTALCYAEFATLIPVSGSAYSYAYATLGELMAWFIGWNLVLEYGVSASAVAVSWTGYFLSLLEHVGTLFQMDLSIPAALTSAPLAFTADHHLVATGALLNLPAVVLILLLTWICYVGIRESSLANAAMVALKVGLITLVIVVGWRYVDPSNWTPFVPSRRATTNMAGAAYCAARRWCSSPTSASRRLRWRRRNHATRSATCRSASSPRWRSAPCCTSRWPR